MLQLYVPLAVPSKFVHANVLATKMLISVTTLTAHQTALVQVTQYGMERLASYQNNAHAKKEMSPTLMVKAGMSDNVPTATALKAVRCALKSAALPKKNVRNKERNCSTKIFVIPSAVAVSLKNHTACTKKKRRLSEQHGTRVCAIHTHAQ